MTTPATTLTQAKPMTSTIWARAWVVEKMAEASFVSLPTNDKSTHHFYQQEQQTTTERLLALGSWRTSRSGPRLVNLDSSQKHFAEQMKHKHMALKIASNQCTLNTMEAALIQHSLLMITNRMLNLSNFPLSYI